MLTGLPPIGGKKFERKKDYTEGDVFFPRSVQISLEGLDLLTSMMLQPKKDQETEHPDQLTIEELVNHPYITGELKLTAFIKPTTNFKQMESWIHNNP